ncbi:NYN domain-containing protein [Sphingomonas sp. HF-S3]|uniref:NYN domain-containing protein n=2 Tax=Sphingomonas rustica TaxID=3103142 RepID=A0ABV0BCZ1_9SPHN
MCKQIFGGENAYEPLISAIAAGSYHKVFYYDAVPGRDHGEAQAAYEARVRPDHERFAKIRALDRVHVALGYTVGPNRRQKGVDVQLAVDMMTHAFRGNLTRATLFAGDADFVPLLRSLVGEGVHVTLWHPPQASEDLKAAADSTRLFQFASDHHCLSLDGQQSGFRAIGVEHSRWPEDEGITRFTEKDGFLYAGRWDGGILDVWRHDKNTTWRRVSLSAPGADLETALTALDAIHSWGVKDIGEAFFEPAAAA